MVRLGHISQVNAVFTDRAPPGPLKGVLEAARVQIHVASRGQGACAGD